MPAQGVSAHVHHPAYAWGDASPCQLVVLVADTVWNHSCPFIRSKVGLDHFDWVRVDRDRDFVEEEEILYLRRRGWDAVLCHQVAQVSQRNGEGGRATVQQTAVKQR